jgi:PAT family beta-lactamase induction signal transducer AmpG
VPLLYFLEGLPYVVVTGMSGLLFKAFALEYPKLGLENDAIAFWTTLIALPWTLKMLWGPMVDLTLTKRKWIVLTQGLLLLGMLILAWAVQLPAFFTVSLLVLLGLAFLSATHDIAADGFYLLSMGKEAQAFFVGVRSTFYRLATIFGSGFLVVIAGQFEKVGNGEPAGSLAQAFHPFYSALSGVSNPVVRAWTAALVIGATVYALAWLLNAFLMPKPAADVPGGVSPEAGSDEEKVGFGAALGEFLNRAKIGWILMFILFYRFGESMISKISPLFLKDPVEKGGLGLPTEAIGAISGTWGVLALVVGGILGGMFIAKYGFRKSVWPMVLALNIPNLFYIWAALNKPGEEIVRWLIVTDQFGYGFGFSAYMVYLMIVARGTRYPTSSYAVATGLMALGATLAGTLSGFLQVQLGYAQFFMLVVLLGIPGVVTLFFIPKEETEMEVVGTGEEDLDALLRSKRRWIPIAVLGAAVALLLAMTLYPLFAPKPYGIDARVKQIAREQGSEVKDSVPGQSEACGDETRQVVVHLLQDGRVVVDIVSHREGSGKSLKDLDGKATLIHSETAPSSSKIPTFDSLCFKGNLE